MTTTTTRTTSCRECNALITWSKGRPPIYCKPCRTERANAKRRKAAPAAEEPKVSAQTVADVVSEVAQDVGAASSPSSETSSSEAPKQETATETPAGDVPPVDFGGMFGGPGGENAQAAANAAASIPADKNEAAQLLAEHYCSLLTLASAYALAGGKLCLTPAFIERIVKPSAERVILRMLPDEVNLTQLDDLIVFGSTGVVGTQAVRTYLDTRKAKQAQTSQAPRPTPPPPPPPPAPVSSSPSSPSSNGVKPKVAPSGGEVLFGDDDYTFA